MTKIRNCEFCKEVIQMDDYYFLYSLGIETDKSTHFIGLEKLMEDLSNFLMDKCVHLSASQIILFRPDILRKFLETIVGEERIIEFCLIKYVICHACYEEYKERIPLM